MDRNRSAGSGQEYRNPRASNRDFPVSSRRAALGSVLEIVGSRSVSSGPVLITGEPGAGKTWLWRRLIQDLPVHWHWNCVDASPALDALEFLRLIGAGVGLLIPEKLGAARLALDEALRDESADGRSWLLVVENSQNASDQVWHEIERITGTSERCEGFGAVLILGRTELVRMMSTRRLRGLAPRFAAHFHLMPLDLDEARALAEIQDPGAPIDLSSLDEIHRDSGGNPRRLIQLLCQRKPIAAVISDKRAPAVPTPSAPRNLAPSRPSIGEIETPQDRPTTVPTPPGRRAALPESVLAPPPIVPARPPLRVEEGLIEVGWSGSLEAEESAEGDKAEERTLAAPIASEPPFREEPVEDRYAALQAWTEWARNREKGPESTVRQVDPLVSGVDVESEIEREHETKPVVAESPEAQGTSLLNPGLRAEAEHDHAPYGQLFTRLRLSK